MNVNRPIIPAVLLLAAGLGLIFAYGIGTTSLNMGYPISGSTLQIAITTTGPAAMGGFALTALGLLLLVWAFVWAVFCEIGLVGSGRVVESRRVVAAREDGPVVVEREVKPRWYESRRDVLK